MKILPFTIPKPQNENIIVQIDRGEKFYSRLHQHQEIQLSYIFSGNGRLMAGNNITDYGPNDFIAIGANLPHLFQSIESNRESKMVSLFFLKDCFGKDFFFSKEMKVLHPILELLPFGVKMKADEKVKKQFEALPKKNEFDVFLTLLEILRHVTGSQKEVLNKQGFVYNLSSDQGQRLQEVIDYTLNNFSKTLALEQVAEKVHLGKNSFCRFFKQRTNKTYFQFLAEVRINNACQLLKSDPELSVAQVALASGYESISNFNRQFKDLMGVSPKTFRKHSASKF